MESIRRYRQEHAGRIVHELVALVRVPNNVYLVEQVQRNSRVVKALLEQRGIRAELWPTATGKPLVYGELLSPGATETVLVYGHYDGVPAERERWHSDPYEPVLRTHMPVGAEAVWSSFAVPAVGPFDDNWRLFGRSVADSKNAIVAMLAALDALRAAGMQPGVNLKFLFDGEEELESPCLPATLERYQDRLKADVMISASGERHQSGRPTVEFGIRGILMFDLTVYTASVAMHSGHFGHFAPSAVFQLSHLLASMKGRDGRVLIEGFCDEVEPLSASEQQAIRQIPSVEERVRRQFGIARAEVEGKRLQELINLPTLNVRGVRSGFVGEEARNIIPNVALADCDVRLVRAMDPDRTLACVAAHIELQGWTVLAHEPSREELLAHGPVVRLRKRSGFPAARTPLDSPIAGRLVAALERAAQEPLVVMPSEGGSLPMCLFEQIGLPFVGLPTSNFDCNQHTDDENLQLKYLFEAVDLFASLFRWGEGLIM